MTALLLLAQAGPPGGDLPFLLRPDVLLVAALGFLFIVWLPRQSRLQREEQQKLLAGVRPGARVVTSGGIVGTVVSAKDGEDEVTVRSADAKLRVLRSSVVRVLGDDPAEAKS